MKLVLVPEKLPHVMKEAALEYFAKHPALYRDAKVSAFDTMAAWDYMIAARPTLDTEAAVERMAIALFKHEWRTSANYDWSAEGPDAKEYWRTAARAALAALLGNDGEKKTCGS